MTQYADIKVIGFDADDTLWENEIMYQTTEDKFCEILQQFASKSEISKKLFEIEMQNLNLYGFGGKSFMLSMIETALKISDKQLNICQVESILNIGKELINQPIILLNGIEKVLSILINKYKLILATKGDLLDQERKLENSGLAKYFHHIEIMSDKTEKHYTKLLKHLDIEPKQFLMVGNSLKSDILPVINIGAQAIYLPFHTTWQHEKVSESIDNKQYVTVNSIESILELI